MWDGFMANQYAYDRQNLHEDNPEYLRRVQITPQLVDHQEVLFDKVIAGDLAWASLPDYNFI